MNDATSTSKPQLPQGWFFDKDGEQVEGRFVSFIRSHKANSGRTMPVLILDVHGEERAVYAYHIALRNRLLKAEFEAGQQVSIRRGPVMQSKKNPDRQYRSYQVELGDE